jgi:2-polyprenyl-3-methyl-5-hydroxy-6-metoxy-1,4-benzoquinol methylase
MSADLAKGVFKPMVPERIKETGPGAECPYSVNSFYRFIARSRIKRTIPYVSGRLLDAGCGIGTMMDYLPEGAEYVGFDDDPRPIAYLRKKNPEAKIFCLDIQKDSLAEEGPFDTVTCLAVVEHVEDPRGFLRRCVDLLRPGGTLVVTSPTKLGEFVRGVICALHLVTPGATEPGETHDANYSLSELSNLVKHSGCEVVAAKHFQLGINQIVVGRKS